MSGSRSLRAAPLCLALITVLRAGPAVAAQVAVVPADSAPPPSGAPVDVRDLVGARLWIAPDAVAIDWPAGAVVLSKAEHEEFYLYRDHEHAHPGATDPVAWARDVARLDGFVIVAAPPERMVELDTVGHCRERLRHLGRAPVAELRPRIGRTADPQVKTTLVDSVNHVRYTQIIRELSGALPAPVATDFVTITNRSTLTAGSGTHIDHAIAYLREQWELRGYTVLEQTFPVGTKTARNLIAVREGTVTPNEVVVVGAHYDSTSEIPLVAAPGAEDNATGSAAVLHLAEVFAGYQTERSVHFVLFGGEEQGLYGSQHYVSQLVPNGWSCVGALTMDMISAWSDDYAVIIEGQLAWEPLMNVMAANVTEFAQIPFTKTYFSFGSDHVPFQQAGIPAFLAIDEDWAVYAPYHRSTDTFDKLDPTLGWRITRAIAGATVDLAGAQPLVDPVDVPTTPPALRLEANRPNPFNPRTEIRFALPVGGATRLEVFDLRGRSVAVLIDEPLPAGPGSVVWDAVDANGHGLASGTYLYRLVHPAGERTRRMVLLR